VFYSVAVPIVFNDLSQSSVIRSDNSFDRGKGEAEHATSK